MLAFRLCQQTAAIHVKLLKRKKNEKEITQIKVIPHCNITKPMTWIFNLRTSEISIKCHFYWKKFLFLFFHSSQFFSPFCIKSVKWWQIKITHPCTSHTHINMHSRYPPLIIAVTEKKKFSLIFPHCAYVIFSSWFLWQLCNYGYRFGKFSCIKNIQGTSCTQNSSYSSR